MTQSPVADTYALDGPEIGSLVDDRFQVGSMLGCGGMATVYRARDMRTGESVALKIPRAGPGVSRRSRALRIESRALQSFAHANIVRVGAAEWDPVPYLATELALGTVSDVVRAQGRMGVDDAAAVAVQALFALDALHVRGWVHRDVKPANLLTFDKGRICLADFGAVLIPDDELTLSQSTFGAPVGTLSFMSPEHTLDSDRVTASADIYSVGATMFALLMARTPFGQTVRGGPAGATLGLPKALDAIVARAMRADPDDRYPSALAMALDLVPHVSSEVWGSQPELRAWLGEEDLEERWAR